jgi:hypothetical protein
MDEVLLLGPLIPRPLKCAPPRNQSQPVEFHTNTNTSHCTKHHTTHPLTLGDPLVVLRIRIGCAECRLPLPPPPPRCTSPPRNTALQRLLHLLHMYIIICTSFYNTDMRARAHAHTHTHTPPPPPLLGLQCQRGAPSRHLLPPPPAPPTHIQNVCRDVYE